MGFTFTEGCHSLTSKIVNEPINNKESRFLRSPHGFSDTDMHSMLLQLKREEENLCAQRGLIQGQDIQTFSISLHRVLIDKWNKLEATVRNALHTCFVYNFYGLSILYRQIAHPRLSVQSINF